jgi:hypothetical protein
LSSNLLEKRERKRKKMKMKSEKKKKEKKEEKEKEKKNDAFVEQIVASKQLQMQVLVLSRRSR